MLHQTLSETKDSSKNSGLEIAQVYEKAIVSFEICKIIMVLI